MRSLTVAGASQAAWFKCKSRHLQVAKLTDLSVPSVPFS